MPFLTEKFMRLVRYPQAEASSDGRTTLVFDGQPVLFQEDGGGLRLRVDLPALPEDAEERHETLCKLMAYAMGRSLKDNAILSYDSAQKTLFLWQLLGGVIDDETLVSQVEAFLAASEWWRLRLQRQDATAHSNSQTLFSRQWPGDFRMESRLAEFAATPPKEP